MSSGGTPAMSSEGTWCGGCFAGLLVGTSKKAVWLKRTLGQGSTKYLLANPVGVKSSSKYDIDKDPIGEGAFGTVMNVRQKATGVQCALKEMQKCDALDVEMLMNEIELQAMMDHPNICRVYETFEDDEIIEIVIESCHGGDILDKIEVAHQFSEPEAHAVFNQMMRGLVYMHSQCVVHRDLKPENLLVKEADSSILNCSVKIIDFGFAQKFEKGTTALTTKCGTPDYIAPEIMADQPYNEKCDVWSAGVILYFFLSGLLPFESENDEETFAKAREAKLSFEDDHWKAASPTAKLLVVQLLKRDPTHRFNASKVWTSPWMKEGENKEILATSTADGVKKRLTAFSHQKRFKQAALNTIARMIDDKEVARLKAAFQALDVDGDGTLTLEEMKRGMNCCSSPSVACEELEAMFNNVCCSGATADGKIDYSEWIAANMRQKQYTEEKICKEAFRMFDKDGSGKISRDELSRMLQVSGPSASPQVDINKLQTEAESLLKECDNDGDGEVDFAEFMSMLRAGPGDDDGDTTRRTSQTEKPSRRLLTVTSQVQDPLSPFRKSPCSPALIGKKNEGWSRMGRARINSSTDSNAGSPLLVKKAWRDRDHSEDSFMRRAQTLPSTPTAKAKG